MSNNAYSFLYKTYRWQLIRERFLKENPTCVMCEADGRLTLATVCDHILPHRGDPQKFYNGPFQALCKTHHDATKQTEEKRGKAIHGGTVDGMPRDPKHHWN